MTAKDPLVFVRHIRDCCLRIAEYIRDGGPDWPSTPVIMDAVCRNITIIGEASRRLSPDFHQAHPEIPWISIIGARNIVMHGYEYLNPRLIREMAEEDAPELLAHCLRILQEP